MISKGYHTAISTAHATILLRSGIIKAMTPHIQALRAITYTTFRAFFVPLVWIVGGIFGVLLVIDIILAILYSNWWLLGLIVIIPLGLIVFVAGLLIGLLAKRLEPRRLEKSDRVQIKSFTDKIIRLVEVRATPLPVVVFLIAKDVVRGRRSSYIEGLLSDSSSLKGDFERIVGMFR